MDAYKLTMCFENFFCIFFWFIMKDIVDEYNNLMSKLNLIIESKSNNDLLNITKDHNIVFI